MRSPEKGSFAREIEFFGAWKQKMDDEDYDAWTLSQMKRTQACKIATASMDTSVGEIDSYSLGKIGLFFMRDDGEFYFLMSDGKMKIYKTDNTEEIADSWSDIVTTFVTNIGCTIVNRNGHLSLADLPALNAPIIYKQRDNMSVLPVSTELDSRQLVFSPPKIRGLNDPVILKQRGEKHDSDDDD
jgi:hypothetical protein